MSRVRPPLVVSTAPFLHGALTTPRLMFDVLFATLPVLAAAAWWFGVSALLVVAAATLGAVATEAWFFRARGTRSLRDGSALLTGVLLGLTLPPSLPLWMAALGGVVAIGFGKLAFGGLGHNLFNPALVGRAFLMAAFPTALTTWVPQGQGFWHVPASTLAWPLMRGDVDGTTMATALSRMKFEATPTAFWPLLSGDVPGSLGETSAVVILACGAWLAWRRAFEWRIPCAILAAAFAGSAALWLADPEQFTAPWLAIASGGLLLGAVFMATDPVSSPTTPRGAWIFGGGIGVLVVLIRAWGGLPEGVMYAILLMNAATPAIERIAQPRAFGRGRHA